MDPGRSETGGGAPRVPDHEVVRRIGEGSHGQVWLARSVLGVWRAVKVVRRDLFRDERPYGREFAGVQRFEPLSREDEGFVDVLHTGRNDAEGYFYYVMELADAVDGEPGATVEPETYEPCTLGRVMAKRGRLDSEAVLELGRRLASAMARLHEAGLLHRDIKPSNIVFVGGRPKLADIGLVVEQSEARSFVGTDGYIAPEGPNSRQADIYSLGMVLYEASTGLRRDDFPRPCDAMDGGSDAGVLRELNAVVMRACAARPEDRYATAGELGGDLALLTSGGSVRRRQRWRRWRRGMAWAAAATLVAGAAWGAWTWQREAWLDAGRRARLAEQELRMSSLHVASATRAMHDGDDAMALVWLAQGIASKEAAGQRAEAERVLARQVRERMPAVRATIMAGHGLFSVTFGPDGERVVTSDDQGFARVWDSNTGALVHGPVRCARRPAHVQLCNDGDRAWSAPRIDLPAFEQPTEATGEVSWFDMATGRPDGARWEGVGWAVGSPDHRWIAAARSGYGVGLGRTDGRSPCRLAGAHGGPVNAMSFSPDSTLLASGSRDGTVKVWSVPDGVLRVQFRVAGRLAALAWGHGSGTLATLARDDRQQRVVQGWDVGTGKERMPSVALGPGGILMDHGGVDGQRLVASLESHDLRVLNCGDGSQALPDIPMRGNRCHAMTVGVDGRWLLTGGADGHANVWSLEDGGLVATIPKHARAVRWVAFHPVDGSWLTAADDGWVRLWRHQGAEHERRAVPSIAHWGPMAGQEGRLEWRRAAWNVRGDVLVTVASRRDLGASPGRDVVLAMDRREGEWRTAAEGLVLGPDPVVVGALAGESWAVKGLVSGNDRGNPASEEVLWLTRREGAWHSSRLRHPVAVADLRVIDPGRLVTVDATGVIRSWAPDRPEPLRTAGVPVHAPRSHVLSPDGSMVASVGADMGRIRVVAWEAPGVHDTEILADGPPSWLTFLGSSYLFGIVHGAPVVWEARRAASWPRFEAGMGRLEDVDWNEPRHWLLNSADAGSLQVFEARTGVRRMIGNGLPFRGRLRASFGGDGRWVVTVDALQNVRVFDSATGMQVTPALAHAGTVFWAGMSADQSLVTLSAPNVFRRWTLAPDPSLASELARNAAGLSGRRVDERGHERWLDPPPGPAGREKPPVDLR